MTSSSRRGQDISPPLLSTAVKDARLNAAATMASNEELDVDALGRPSFLGQMYNARSGKLLGFTLFPSLAIKEATKDPENTPNAINKYEEVRESEARASLLDISASVSVFGRRYRIESKRPEPLAE